PGCVGAMAPNVVLRGNRRLDGDLAAIATHRPPIVITSVGSPRGVVPALHDAGVAVLADVGSERHADRAVDDGVDGLVLLTAGAGGQTGWANPFAFVRSVRRRWPMMPIVLAGGIGDGVALRAAVTLGCDLAYMGTRFLATVESTASAAHKQLVVDATFDDVRIATSPMGLPANFLDASIPRVTADAPAEAWSSAGHVVSVISDIPTVGQLLAQTELEFRERGFC
ncbi:MAG TPA: nitronate monooxygenase, partial [Ilumatobacteraceae bacterium]